MKTKINWKHYQNQIHTFYGEPLPKPYGGFIYFALGALTGAGVIVSCLFLYLYYAK